MPKIPPPMPATLVKDTTTTNFRQDVIAESMHQPVLVDFWAPWCGPCKQLTPVIEKAVKAAGGKVKLVKMNIDEHPQIAGQLGIQSIPAVLAFQRGPARRRLHGRAAGKPGEELHRAARRAARAERRAEDLLAEADALAAQGDAAGAAELYAAVLTAGSGECRGASPPSPSSISISTISRARSASSPWFPRQGANDPAIAGARAAIELAEQAASLGDLGDLERRVGADPLDHQARFDLALALNARGRREEAVEPTP